MRSQIEARPKEAARPPSADPQEAADQGGRRGSQEAADHHREAKPQDPTLMIVLKLMEGMQAIQQKLVEDRNEEKGGSEFVRSNTPLPALAEWTPASGPIDLSDWLALIEPMMGPHQHKQYLVGNFDERGHGVVSTTSSTTTTGQGLSPSSSKPRTSSGQMGSSREASKHPAFDGRPRKPT